MATDFTGRRAVNLTISEVTSGTTIPEIAEKLKSGKSIGDVANEQHVDWKQMASEAKKLNAGVDTNLYNYFLFLMRRKAWPKMQLTSTTCITTVSKLMLM
jgi:hypothetical protein